MINKGKNLQIIHDKKDDRQPWRVVDLADNKFHIVFFCETEELAKQFIENPAQFKNPIEEDIINYYVKRCVKS